MCHLTHVPLIHIYNFNDHSVYSMITQINFCWLGHFNVKIQEIWKSSWFSTATDILESQLPNMMSQKANSVLFMLCSISKFNNSSQPVAEKCQRNFLGTDKMWHKKSFKKVFQPSFNGCLLLWCPTDGKCYVMCKDTAPVCHWHWHRTGHQKI